MDNIYRVAITKNKKLYKVIKDYKNLKHAKNRFTKFQGENLVLFPKVFFNHKKILKKDYEILLLRKRTTEDIRFRKFIANNGKVITEEVVGDWVIMKKVDWLQEEEFHVYGLKSRLNVVQLLKQVFVPRMMSMYQIIMVLNKIVVISDSDIEVILCKNIQDCERLYDYLFDFLKKEGIHNLLFLGTASKSTRRAYYDRMQEHTGLTRQELYRTSTRS